MTEKFSYPVEILGRPTSSVGYRMNTHKVGPGPGVFGARPHAYNENGYYYEENEPLPEEDMGGLVACDEERSDDIWTV